MPQSGADIARQPGFWNLPREKQVEALSAVTPEFSQASPETQQAALDSLRRFVSQPPSTPSSNVRQEVGPPKSNGASPTKPQEQPSYLGTALRVLASPITGILSAPGEVIDWAKRGFHNPPSGGFMGEEPITQAYGNALMALGAEGVAPRGEVPPRGGVPPSGGVTPLAGRLESLKSGSLKTEAPPTVHPAQAPPEIPTRAAKASSGKTAYEQAWERATTPLKVVRAEDPVTPAEYATFREKLKSAGYLGFNSANEAISAIATHPDWVERWDIQRDPQLGPEFIRIGNKLTGQSHQLAPPEPPSTAPAPTSKPKPPATVPRTIDIQAAPAPREIEHISTGSRDPKLSRALQKYVKSNPKSTPEAAGKHLKATLSKPGEGYSEAAYAEYARNNMPAEKSQAQAKKPSSPAAVPKPTPKTAEPPAAQPPPEIHPAAAGQSLTQVGLQPRIEELFSTAKRSNFKTLEIALLDPSGKQVGSIGASTEWDHPLEIAGQIARLSAKHNIAGMQIRPITNDAMQTGKWYMSLQPSPPEVQR